LLVFGKITDDRERVALAMQCSVGSHGNEELIALPNN
jgi:hypothetical protein